MDNEMAKMKDEELRENVRAFLESGKNAGCNLGLRDVYRQFDANKKDKKREREIIKEVFGGYFRVRLCYRRGHKKIESITNAMQQLIDNGGEPLDFNQKHNIVLLTPDNAKKVESAIRQDLSYIPFSKYLFEYFGKNKVLADTDGALFAVIREIDRDNSTNVWRYDQNRSQFKKMIEWIKDPVNRFFANLKNSDKKLPDRIVKECGTGLKSLASKVCKYLCEFLYQLDNYFINDSFVRRALLFYLDYYDVPHKEFDSSYVLDSNETTYSDLFDLLDSLRTAAQKKHGGRLLKRSELDHILWYCYKSFDL